MTTFNKIKYQSILILLLLPTIMLGQTVNTGDLYISPGTILSTVPDFNNTTTGTVINDGEFYVYADFNNDGDVDFTNGEEGLTRFEGTAVQQLSGGKISYFYDVLFNNSSSTTASFELSSEISVANEANFSEGIVKNDDFGGMITFEDNADHIGTFDNSHVDGFVQKNGDDSFTFPIGDKQLYRFAAISAPNGIAEHFTAKYYFENPVGITFNNETPTASKAGVITVIDTAEYWTVTNDTDASNVLLTLSYADGLTTPDDITKNPESGIHIVRWNDSEQLWVDEGGIVDVSNKTVTTPLRIDGEYGIFTLGRVNEALTLPGDVVVYNGVTPNGDGVNDYFLIDGIQNLANNKLQVFNRWGVEVYATEDYDTNGNVFNGFSNGRITINEEAKLPTGTYYYVLSYDFSNNGSVERIKKAGFLYITTE